MDGVSVEKGMSISLWCLPRKPTAGPACSHPRCNCTPAAYCSRPLEPAAAIMPRLCAVRARALEPALGLQTTSLRPVLVTRS